ncbi:MAG: GNAT family N-acetyltransferase [Pseudomonadota bacterium]
MMNVEYRSATVRDAVALAPMNAQLILDEGHRSSLTISQLQERMSGWLKGEYQATLFELESRPIGYALYRIESEYVYLRQIFVLPGRRRRGVARAALEWLRGNAWARRSNVRIDVLVGNRAGIEFWRSVGFTDYCITMERTY